VGLYTELFYAIIPTLLPLCWPYISWHVCTCVITMWCHA